MTKDSPKSIVFISGTFIGNNCWDEWKQSFGRKGYTCTAPAWPYKDASPEELRNRHPNSAITSNRLNVITDYYAKIAKALPEEPILIGHSLGGLIVQLLLQRGIGAAGVAIHSFPPAGLFTSKFLFLKAVWPAMGFLTSSNKTYMVSFLKWKHTIVNGIPCVAQKQMFYKYAIPESKLIVRDVFKCAAKIDFSKYRSPLLLISGGCDRIVPASLVLGVYKRYRLNNSITDYKHFGSRNHLPFENHSCNEEADFILYWLQGIK